MGIWTTRDVPLPVWLATSISPPNASMRSMRPTIPEPPLGFAPPTRRRESTGGRSRRLRELDLHH
jgi:hypothetical protein